MDALAIIGVVLVLGSGANLNADVSVWAMVMQFLTGLALSVPAYIKLLGRVIENESN